MPIGLIDIDAAKLSVIRRPDELAVGLGASKHRPEARRKPAWSGACFL